MKPLFVVMGIVVSLGLFSACSSDDDNNLNGKEYEDDKVSEFFKAELPEYNRSESFFNNSNENICFVINSKKELQDVYFGNRELPEIDFQKYTLIIGQEILSSSYHPILRQELVSDDGKLILYIYTKGNPEGMYYSMIQYLNYWGVYPKFESKEVTIKVIDVIE